jgi:glyoxylase-like metal-dependent hydrolase (beta-lactamase superfamily II)
VGKVEVQFLNCGVLRPRGAKVFVPQMTAAPCLCLLIRDGDGAILVDSGFGTRDMEDPTRLGFSNHLLNMDEDEADTAFSQVRKLGIRTEEVRHIICTHLDRDHAGGLSDFPDASVHVTRLERDAALARETSKERNRYRPAHFEHGVNWVTYEAGSDEKWFGLECIRVLEGLPPEIVLVPLPGHTRGHCGVAVDTGDGWLLHCGDTYYCGEELEYRKAPAGIRAFRRLAHMDFSQAMTQLAAVRKIARDEGSVELIASHDAAECEKRLGRKP